MVLHFFPLLGAHPTLHRGSSAHLKVVGGPHSYTDEEKRVLLSTSRINEREYVPFMSIDLKEKFQYALPFSDKNGTLALSPKQKAAFDRWARPLDYCEDPVMVSGNQVDPYSIKQTVSGSFNCIFFFFFHSLFLLFSICTGM